MEIEEISTIDINNDEEITNYIDEEEDYNNKKSMNKGMRGVFNMNNKYKQKTLLSSEIRLKKDIEELKKNQDVGKFCEIILNEYKKIEGTEDFQMIVEFINHFSVKFIFTSEFPFEPPKIIYFAGNKYPFLFDTFGNIILNLLKAQNWSPTFWISKLIINIEKIISEETNNIFYLNNINSNNNKIGKIFSIKKRNYYKRNWEDYLKSVNNSVINEYLKISELKTNKLNTF